MTPMPSNFTSSQPRLGEEATLGARGNLRGYFLQRRVDDGGHDRPSVGRHPQVYLAPVPKKQNFKIRPRPTAVVGHTGGRSKRGDESMSQSPRCVLDAQLRRLFNSAEQDERCDSSLFHDTLNVLSSLVAPQAMNGVGTAVQSLRADAGSVHIASRFPGSTGHASRLCAGSRGRAWWP